MIHQRSFLCTSLLVALFNIPGCSAQNPIPHDLSRGTVLKQDRMDVLHDELAAKITSATANVMTQPGLVGAMGGAHVKLLKSGAHQVLLPVPQLTDAQVPICFFIRSTPPGAVEEYRLQRRENSNDIVSVRLKGDANQEVQLEWSAVVLLAGKTISPNNAPPESYRSPTACVQADSSQIKKLADELWPKSARVKDYAGNIQRFIQEMKQAKQPRSLDALGILDSRANGICTANANLASALLRAKRISCRSMAVIPPTSQRLEMHRIVEYHDENEWHYFDPSSLHGDVPMKPWQTVVMAKTTVTDENVAMKPRMGSMFGCPYGQELELVSSGMTLWGQNFFWTIAKPLAEFQPDDQSIPLATNAWNRYLQSGTLSPGQIKAHSATSSTEFLDALIAR